MNVNGLAKKMAANGVGVVNGGGGGKSTASQETALSQNTQLPKPAPITRGDGGLFRALGRGQQNIQPITQGGGEEDPPQPTPPSPSHSPVSHNNGSSPPPFNCQNASPQLLEAEPEQPPSSSDPMHTTTTTTTTDHRPGPPSSPLLRPPSPPTATLQLQERSQQTQRRQTDIEGRMRRLRKRLQVVQAKQVERHVQQQLSGFVEQTAAHHSGSSRHVPSDPWGRTDPSSASTSSSSGVASFLRGGTVPADLERLHVSGSSFLHSAEVAFDSDATESSSGGESDVEQEEIARADPDKRHVKLWRRAKGRYAVERASIISHWNWLQAHVSDLEYRIRQQAEIYRQIRASKGAVELGEPVPCEPSAETEPSPFATSEAGDSEKADKTAATCNTINSIPNSAEDIFGRKPLGVTPDPTCVAARTRPLLSCRRRRFVNPSAVPNLTGKVQRGCVACCGVNPSCLMCGGGRPPQPTPPPLELSVSERLTHIDTGIHPILSLPSDTKLSIHLQGLIKAQGQGSHAEKLKPLKKRSLKHKIALSGIHLPQPPSSSSSKHKHKLGNSHMATVRLAHHRKSRLERSYHHTAADRSASVSKSDTPCRPERPHERSQSRKRPRELSGERADGPKQPMDPGSPLMSLSSVLFSTPSPLSRQLSLPYEGSTPLGPGSQPGSAPIRRRRGESSFDINNIVIPMSVAATTRVEKLQYKEILTPRWRKVDVLEEPAAEDEEEAEIEDLTDMAFTELHLPMEDQERSRWSWRALVPAARRGSRLFKSLDGRTTPLPGGSNPYTPQPSSPDMALFHVLQDYGPLSSPLSPPSPDTPSSRDSLTRCSTPDFTYEERTVNPWERRFFPLSEDPAILDEPSEPDNESRNTSGIPSGHSRAESESEPVSP
ncbi:KAT8 regulatory NSL complex subunit 1 [Clupea harengus]|uniref:KAT8 regulatory NSL complex subunit 1 n=1 Tax=Clupea harengus TaxID=7950 RepID=A0A8M1K5S3_CLUHA|nr:KAT8 regulatory NSL complex subunit 1 [Clupea harengus]